MSTFNGHKNWNHWNVSLWLNNDEGLYRTARELKRRHGSAGGAVAMLDELSDMGITKTPDDAPYSVTTIRAAMGDM